MDGGGRWVAGLGLPLPPPPQSWSLILYSAAEPAVPPSIAGHSRWDLVVTACMACQRRKMIMADS